MEHLKHPGVALKPLKLLVLNVATGLYLAPSATSGSRERFMTYAAGPTAQTGLNNSGVCGHRPTQE